MQNSLREQQVKHLIGQASRYDMTGMTPVSMNLNNAGIHLGWKQEWLLPGHKAGIALLQWWRLHVFCHQPHIVVDLVHQVVQGMCGVGPGRGCHKVP